MQAMRRILVLALVLLGGCATLPHNKPVDVTIAELRSAPESYAGRMVRVRGIWIYGFEASDLVAHDYSERPAVWIDTESHTSRIDDGFRKFRAVMLREAIRQTELADARGSHAPWLTRSTVEIEGVFDVAPSPRPETASDGEEYLMWQGFGHLGGAPFQIRLTHLNSFHLEE